MRLLLWFEVSIWLTNHVHSHHENHPWREEAREEEEGKALGERTPAQGYKLARSPCSVPTKQALGTRCPPDSTRKNSTSMTSEEKEPWDPPSYMSFVQKYSSDPVSASSLSTSRRSASRVMDTSKEQSEPVLQYSAPTGGSTSAFTLYRVWAGTDSELTRPPTGPSRPPQDPCGHSPPNTRATDSASWGILAQSFPVSSVGHFQAQEERAVQSPSIPWIGSF